MSVRVSWSVLRRYVLITLGVWLLSGTTLWAQPAPQPLKLGVLTTDDQATSRQLWQETVDYLNQTLPNHHSELVMLEFEAIEAAVKNRQIDFLITNPTSYVALEHQYGLNALLTLQRRLATGETTSVFASAILTRADHHDIQKLHDLTGKRFAAAHEHSFGGWAMAWRQMVLNNITPYKDLQSIDFLGNDEDVIRAVLSGAVDAGSVTSGVLEQMIASGKVQPGELRTLPEEGPLHHQPYELPEQHSTAYYPEWPLARLAHIDDQTARELSQALLAFQPHEKSVIGGWIPPLNYTPVHTLMQDLRLAQYQEHGKFGGMDLIRQNWQWASLLLLFILLLPLITLRVMRLNLHNRETTRNLQKELAEKIVAQQETLAQKEKLSHILESIAEAYFSIDNDWRITSANHQALELFNRPRESLIGKDLWQALPELTNIAHSSFSRSFEMGEPFEFTAHYQSSDQWLEFHTYPSTNGMGIYFRDITARIKASLQIEESEERLRAILENILEGVITIDATGVIQGFNKAAQNIFGYTNNEVVGKRLDMLMPAPIGGEHNRFINNYLMGGQPKVIGLGRELYGKRKHGDIFPMDVSVSEVVINGQRMFVGLCRDISARKQIEAKTIQLATAVDHAAEGIFITNPTGEVSYANPAYAAMRGMSSSEIIGQKAVIFELANTHPEQYPGFYDSLQKDKEPWRGQYSARRNNGLHYIEQTTIAAVHKVNGDIDCYVGVCRDITSSLHYEQQQRHIDQIEALAGIATGISYEFNSLLSTIIEQTNTALNNCEPRAIARKNITQVLGVANRAQILVHQLLGFNQLEYDRPQLLNPYETVKGIVALLQSLLPATVAIKQRLASDIDGLWIAPGQLQQVVINLLLNIIKALDGNTGSVEITLEQCNLTADSDEVNAGLIAGHYLALTITDSAVSKRNCTQSGKNVACEVDSRELSAIQDVIRKNGGAFYIETKQGQGTTFKIYLPLVTTVQP